jgi:hypothetical protein
VFDTSCLSESAIALIRLRAQSWVLVTDANRAAFRELVRAGLMESLHTFAHGPEGANRFTELG